MKILLVTGIYPPDIGGPATFIPELSRFLSDKGHDLRILTLAQSTNRQTSDKVPVIRIQRKIPKILRMIIIITKIVLVPREYKIFANGLHEEVGISLLFRKRYAVAKIVGDPVWERCRNRNGTKKNILEFNQTNNSTKSYLERKLLTLGLNQFKTITCPSEELCEIVESWNVTKPIKYIANGVSTKEVNPVFQWEFDLICVSRLVSWKNINKHIEIAKELNLKLAIVGSGPEEIELKEFAKSLGCNATFFGEKKKIEIEELLKKSKVFILLSEYEGLSFSLLEAMSFGLPAIVSNIRSNSSVVRDGIDGAVIEIENWRSSESEIVRLFADNQYYQSVSNNVRIRISDEFNARKQFEKIEELFLR
jgi:glycosyltransferase involved in cell wall biosynthesis